MPPSKSKKIIRLTLAVFALAGILGVLGLVERTSQSPKAAESGLDAKLAADFFGGGGGSGAPAFSGDLNSFVGSQFGPDALASLTPSERANVSGLFAAGQALPGNPSAALRALRLTPGANSNRAIFNAIRGAVFDTLRAAMRGCRDGGLGICARILAKINQMAGGGGPGGGGGTS